MDSKNSSHAAFFGGNESEESRSRVQYKPYVMPYMVNQLHATPATPMSRYDGIPLQHLNMVNMHPGIRPALQMSQGVYNSSRSLSSIPDPRIEGRRSQIGTRPATDGGFEPRGFRLYSLPRSKSVRHGINHRFLRNEESAFGDIALQMLRHNTVACLNDIPRSTFCMEEFSPTNRRFLRNEAAYSSSSGRHVNGVAPRHSRRRRSAEHQRKETAPPTDRVYENTKPEIEFPTVGVEIPLEDNASENWEDCWCRSNWREGLIIASITFVASLTGAAVYSLIGCTITGCAT